MLDQWDQRRRDDLRNYDETARCVWSWALLIFPPLPPVATVTQPVAGLAGDVRLSDACLTFTERAGKGLQVKDEPIEHGRIW